jgi:hypothetical protein
VSQPSEWQKRFHQFREFQENMVEKRIRDKEKVKA